MTELRIFDDAASAPADQPLEILTDFDAISGRLHEIGVLMESWDFGVNVDREANQDEVIEAYREPINRLMQTYGFSQVDVVGMHPDHPQKDVLREKFLHEHTHDDFEARFFVDGEGLFCIHHENRVYAVRCTKGNLISVPAKMRHWFDMGQQPDFQVIRLFSKDEGRVSHYTGDSIAERFPRIEQLSRVA